MARSSIRIVSPATSCVKWRRAIWTSDVSTWPWPCPYGVLKDNFSVLGLEAQVLGLECQIFGLGLEIQVLSLGLAASLCN